MSVENCSYILNKPFTEWIEEHRLITASQACFRRNYTTIDRIFTLPALVQKQLHSHGKLYVAFVDFKKTFDLVDRSCLWAVLRKNSTRGKYTEQHKACTMLLKQEFVQVGTLQRLSCAPLGLEQGDICSPVLFSLFFNELVNEIMQNGKHGITLSPELIQILIMLFADDEVLLSYTVIGPQRQFNILRDTAKKIRPCCKFSEIKCGCVQEW